jgi:hypothetical protein
MFFPETEEIRQITFNGANPTFGNQNVQLRIPRQSRWLSDIIVHVNVSVVGGAAAWTSPTANRDYLENIMSEVRLRISDKAGPNRLAVKCPGVTLLAWHFATNPALDRYTQRVIRNASAYPVSAATNTLDLFFPVHLRHPQVGEPIGVRTCIPLFSGGETGISDDLILELDFNSLANAIPGYNPGTGGSVTINRVTAKLIFVNAPQTITYIPQELVADLPSITASTSSGYDIPRQGLLSSLLFEEFTDTAYAVRGIALASNNGSQNYSLKYARTSIKDFYPGELTARSDWFSVPKPDNGSTEVIGQTPFTSFLDMLNPRPNDSAFSANSLLNLYGDQQGDLARLEWTALASANARLRLTRHKFFTTQLADLAGA